MGWLQEHLETFVKPYLGEVPTLKDKDYKPYFTPQQHSLIKSIWRATKREAERLGKPILLAGRDVFVYEILARREGYPTVFRPDISGITVDHVKEDYKKHLLLDTGYSGTIPRKLGCEHYLLSASNLIPYRYKHVTAYTSNAPRDKFMRKLIRDKEREHVQVFPRLRDAQSLANTLEGSPKYWYRAGYVAPNVDLKTFYNYEAHAETSTEKDFNPVTRFVQGYSSKLTFKLAALLTIEVYTNSAPRFISNVGVNLERR